jgi:glycosyltransferase involved in cell wall biosynthesis
MKPGSTDVVLASGPPFAGLSLADRLSVQLRCPFVMDYRDLWTSNPYCDWLATKRNLAEEARLLAKCAAAVVVSPQSAEVLGRRMRPHRLHVVTNGYDPERLSGIVPRSFSDRAMVYAGCLLPPLRTLDPVLRAMALVAQRAGKAQIPMKLHFFGDGGRTVAERASELGLESRVADHGRVSRRSALEALAGAHLVVVVESVLDNVNAAGRGVIPGKVFEALGLGKRILVIAPNGADVEEIVGESGRRFSGRQTREIADHLVESTAPERPCAVTPPTRYSWEQLAVAYDGILQDAINSRLPRKAGLPRPSGKCV